MGVPSGVRFIYLSCSGAMICSIKILQTCPPVLHDLTRKPLKASKSYSCCRISPSTAQDLYTAYDAETSQCPLLHVAHELANSVPR